MNFFFSEHSANTQRALGEHSASTQRIFIFSASTQRTLSEHSASTQRIFIFSASTRRALGEHSASTRRALSEFLFFRRALSEHSASTLLIFFRATLLTLSFFLFFFPFFLSLTLPLNTLLFLPRTLSHSLIGILESGLRRRGVQPKSGGNILADVESNQILLRTRPQTSSPPKIGKGHTRRRGVQPNAAKKTPKTWSPTEIG